MKASIVIPTYNGRRLLEACLYSLMHDQLVDHNDEFEVIVVDDGSSDDTGHWVRSFQSNYLLTYLYKQRTASSSRAAARNLGIRNAQGEVVIFLDGDHIVPPGFVAAHLEVHKRNKDTVAIGLRKHLSDGHVALDRLRDGFHPDLLPPTERDDERTSLFSIFPDLDQLMVRWYLFWTCNVSVRRKHVLKVGGFDEKITGWGNEDIDLGYRLHRLGMKFVPIHDPVVYHQYHPRNQVEEDRDYQTSLDYLKKKHNDLLFELINVAEKTDIADGNSWHVRFIALELSSRILLGKKNEKTLVYLLSFL